MTAPDATPEDQTALANEIRFTIRLGLIQPDSMAHSILASSWLAQRDARIKAEALRSVAEDFEIEDDEATAHSLREWADRFEAQP